MPDDRPEVPPPGAGQPPPAPGPADWSPAPSQVGGSPPAAGTGDTGWSPATGGTGDAGWSPPDPPRRRPVGLALVLITVGVVWLLALAGVNLPWEVLVPGALVVVGVLVLLSPRWGGGSGLIGLGIALAILALVVAVPSPAALSAGERTIAVTDVADLEDRYGLGAGTMTLDLRSLELPPGTTEVQAGVNLGELVVLVPPDASITGEGRAFLGEVESFERTSSGVAPRAELTEPGDDLDRVLDLRLRVGLGQIEVRR
jgi:hypothetical protein